MRSKEKLLEGSGLCVIIDMDILARDRALYITRAAVKAGADMIQLRSKGLDTVEALKTAKAIRRITLHKAAFIVNDRLEVAVASDSDGIHIGLGDIDIKLAKKLLGQRKIVGVSASGFKKALSAKNEGASYLGVGPVFKTPIKRGKRPCGIGLLENIRKLKLPVFLIGGINERNIQKLTAKGFKRVAVIRAVIAANDPFQAVCRLKKALI